MRQLLLGLAFVASLNAASPLFHASFDSAKPAWTVLRGAATPDAAVTHDGQMSMRLESEGHHDARVQSAPIALTIGKDYELTGWIRTDKLLVRDLDRSPIATGAALSMASLPRGRAITLSSRPRTAVPSMARPGFQELLLTMCRTPSLGPPPPPSPLTVPLIATQWAGGSTSTWKASLTSAAISTVI